MTNQTLLQRQLWKYACLGAIAGTASGYVIDRVGGHWAWGFAILIFVCYAFGTFWIDGLFLAGIYGLEGSPPRPYIFRFLLRDFWRNPKGGTLFLLLWILGIIHLFGPIFAAAIASPKEHRASSNDLDSISNESDPIQRSDSFVRGVAALPFAILAFIPGAVAAARLRYRAWRASYAALPALVAELRHPNLWVRHQAMLDLAKIAQRHGIKGSAAHGVIAALIAAIHDNEDRMKEAAVNVLSAMGTEAAEAVPVVLATLRKSQGKMPGFLLVSYTRLLDKLDPDWVIKNSTSPKSDD